MKALKIAAIALAGAGVVTAMPAAAETVDEYAQKRMRSMDKNADGAVTLEEFTQWRSGWAMKRDDGERLMRPASVQRAFDKIDSDGDGSLTSAEILAEAASRRSEG